LLFGTEQVQKDGQWERDVGTWERSGERDGGRRESGVSHAAPRAAGGHRAVGVWRTAASAEIFVSQYNSEAAELRAWRS